MKTVLVKLDKFVFNAFSQIAIWFLVGLFILMGVNVLLRFFPIFSLGWFDEIIEFMFSWMVFCEAAVLWRIKQHPYIDLLETKLKTDISKNRLFIMIECINISFLSIFVYYSSTLVLSAIAWSPIFKIPKKLYYLSMPLAGFYMILSSLFFIYEYYDKLRKAKAEKRTKDVESLYKIGRA